MLNPFIKLARSVQERGWRGTVLQLYTVGDLKFGKLMGTDKFGNQYYEDRTLPYGQHRWVEYTNIHNPDTTMIQPEWHGWMHHVYDETPDKVRTKFDDKLLSTEETNAIFEDHIGDAHPIATDQVNLTQYRQRGYKVGSLMTGPNDPDLYYKQPGHPLSPDTEKGGRFQNQKNVTEWTPDKP